MGEFLRYNPERMAKLTDTEIRHVAKLANIPITDEEVKKYGEQLSVILEYIEQLDSVDTTGVEPTFNVSGSVNIYHPDETIAGLLQEEALQNTKEKKNGMFVVKRVVGGE